jgi:hypothetical protein
VGSGQWAGNVLGHFLCTYSVSSCSCARRQPMVRLPLGHSRSRPRQVLKKPIRGTGWALAGLSHRRDRLPLYSSVASPRQFQKGAGAGGSLSVHATLH